MDWRFTQPRKFLLQPRQELLHLEPEDELLLCFVALLLHGQEMVPQPAARSGVARQRGLLHPVRVELQSVCLADPRQMFPLRSLSEVPDAARPVNLKTQ